MSQILEIEERIKKVLAQIRPYLIEDGGDVELVELSSAMVAKIELKGNCTTCSMNSMTFKNSIVDTILKSVPEVKSVDSINFKVIDNRL